MRLTLIMLMLLGFCGAAPAEQTCNTSEAPLSVPTERFQLNGDGTVTDTVSGLMWMRCAVGQTWREGRCDGDPRPLDWSAASAAAEAVNGEGEWFFNDWRVPGLRDLALIIERQCVDPRTNLTVFPDTPAAFFWTSTLRPGEESGDAAYALSFGPEGVEQRSKAEPHYLRLVRTAQ
jgi:hypothetical protein